MGGPKGQKKKGTGLLIHPIDRRRKHKKFESQKTLVIKGKFHENPDSTD